MAAAAPAGSAVPVTRPRRRAVLAAAAAVAVAVAGCGGGGGDEDATSARERIAGAAVAITAGAGGGAVRGSGTVVDAERGLVLTTAHTVWGERTLRLATAAGTVLGRPVAVAPCSDLALLETQPRPAGLTALPLADSGRLRAGDRLTAAGFAWGDAGPRLAVRPASLTGARVRAAAAPGLPRFVALTHDAGLGRTSSGGALVDEDGGLVGLLSRADGGPDIAVPADRLRRRLDALRPARAALLAGWEDEAERCGGRLDRYAAAQRPGATLVDAQPGGPVPPPDRSAAPGDQVPGAPG
jgi:S1-C subfamily serine protease